MRRIGRNPASDGWRAWSKRLLCLASLTLTGTTLAADDAALAESLMRGERPSMDGEPTVIEVGVYLMDIDEIDDVDQRFSVDLFLVARWQDPRLALPEAERQGRKRALSFDEIWTPRVLVLNDRGLTPQLPQRVDIDDLGNVTYRNRLSGELAANLEFRDFPFDVQRLPIDLVSYAHTADELRFSPHSAIVSQPDQFSIEGWQLRPLQPETGVFVAPHNGAELPRLTYVVEAHRNSNYYVLTMLVPMSLIIFMAWTVFWLQPDIVPSRIAISTASIFSLIALGVSIRLSLPKISYLTKADLFVLGCTLMVFGALGIAVIGSRWANSGRMERALKANAIARWVYLFLFVGVAVVAFRH